MMKIIFIIFFGLIMFFQHDVSIEKTEVAKKEVAKQEVPKYTGVLTVMAFTPLVILLLGAGMSATFRRFELEK